MSGEILGTIPMKRGERQKSNFQGFCHLCKKVKAEAFEDKDQTIYGWSITIHSLQGITPRNPNYFASILRFLRISLTYLLIHITLMLSLPKCGLLWQHFFQIIILEMNQWPTTQQKQTLRNRYVVELPKRPKSVILAISGAISRKSNMKVNCWTL